MEEASKPVLSWNASEYVHHEKDPIWFLLFGAGIAALLSGMYFLLRDVISVIVILLMAVTVMVFANRKPRTLHYELHEDGIVIEGRQYAFRSFKSFSIMQMGIVESIFLEPLERFMPPISIYFDPKDGDIIVNALGNALPARERDPDFVDRLVHRLRL
jgi:hypothetical protein